MALPRTCSRIVSCRPVDFVIPVIVRDVKFGWDKSCLHNDVPSTPHPTIAMLSGDGVIGLLAAGDEKAFALVLDDDDISVNISTDRRRDMLRE